MRMGWQKQIILHLINKTEHGELLKSVPHRSFLDMAVVYGTVEQMDERNLKYQMITNAIMEVYELTEDQLYEFALENTPTLSPCIIRTGEEMMQRMWESLTGEDWPDHLSNPMPGSFFVSNAYWHFGANALLYNEIFDNLAKQVDDNLWVLPLTCHELLVTKAEVSDLEVLAKELQGMNENSKWPKDVLSDQIYLYDQKEREFKQLTDFPERAFSEKRIKELENENRSKGTAR